MAYDLASSPHCQAAVPVFNGGAQPYASRLLPPAQGISVDNIAFDRRNPQMLSQIVVLAQPDAWPYEFFGAGQPYAPAQLSPQLTIPRIDAPPPAANAATRATQILINQPDPWTSSFSGASQPYAPRRGSAGVPGFSIPPISFDRRAVQTNAVIVALAQSDAWTYLHFGAGAPYQPSRLNASIPAVRVDQPPPVICRPTTVNLEIAQINLADNWIPWTYLFLGAAQPYTPTKISGSAFVAGPTPLDRRMFQTNIELSLLAQADFWSYTFVGGVQPYAPLRQSPGIPGIDREPAPLDRRYQQNLLAQPTYQSDPWTFCFVGGFAPYQAKILNAQSVFVQIDNPPFGTGGPYAEIGLAIGLAQPDPWIYGFFGTRQPYTPRALAPSITAVKVDAPPNAITGGPYALAVEGVARAQPDAWSYSFFGGAQPYVRGMLNPVVTGVRVDQPPGSRTIPPGILSAWLPQELPPPSRYRLKVTVRLGRSRAVVIT
jgi:hypothetical protein